MEHDRLREARVPERGDESDASEELREPGREREGVKAGRGGGCLREHEKERNQSRRERKIERETGPAVQYRGDRSREASSESVSHALEKTRQKGEKDPHRPGVYSDSLC